MYLANSCSPTFTFSFVHMYKYCIILYILCIYIISNTTSYFTAIMLTCVQISHINTSDQIPHTYVSNTTSYLHVIKYHIFTFDQISYYIYIHSNTASYFRAAVMHDICVYVQITYIRAILFDFVPIL